MSEKGIPVADDMTPVVNDVAVFAPPEVTGRLAKEAGLTIDPRKPGIARSASGAVAYWDNVNWQWCDLDTDAPLSSRAGPAPASD